MLPIISLFAPLELLPRFYLIDDYSGLKFLPTRKEKEMLLAVRLI